MSDKRLEKINKDLLEAAKHFKEMYEIAMHGECDFPNDPWSYERDKDKESIKHVKAISAAEKEVRP